MVSEQLPLKAGLIWLSSAVLVMTCHSDSPIPALSTKAPLESPGFGRTAQWRKDICLCISTAAGRQVEQEVPRALLILRQLDASAPI